MESLNELATLIMNTGASLGCLVYFMWFNAKHTEKNNQLLNELKALIQIVYDKLNKEE